MTEKQEEVVKRLNISKIYAGTHDDCAVVNKYDLETALDMLQEKDVELKSLEYIKEIMNSDVKELVDLTNIEKIKSKNWILQTKLDEKDKEIEKYKYLYQKALDNTVSADRENINLKKQIKEMAKYIAKEDVSETFCDYKTVCDQNCEECVEAYFKEESE